ADRRGERRRQKGAAEQRSADRRRLVRPELRGQSVDERRNLRRIDEQRVEREPQVGVIARLEQKVPFACRQRGQQVAQRSTLNAQLTAFQLRTPGEDVGELGSR